MFKTTTSKAACRPALSLPSMAKTVELRVWRTSACGLTAAVSSLRRLDDTLVDLDSAVGRCRAGRCDEHGDAGVRLEEAEEPGDAVPPAGALVVGAVAAPQPAEQATAALVLLAHERGELPRLPGCRTRSTPRQSRRQMRRQCTRGGWSSGLAALFPPDVAVAARQSIGGAEAGETCAGLGVQRR